MSNRKIDITANGKHLQVSLQCSLADFLTQSGWKPTQVVVELNGNVLARGKVGEVELREGDQLEVIVPVAGG
jgi:thiamine biosynthesis protein ThiS